MDNYYSDSSGYGEILALLLGALVLGTFISIALYIYFGFALSAIFKKAGHPNPWAAWVPVYNYWVMLEIGKQKGWWMLVYVGAMFLSVIPILGNFIQLAGAIFVSIAFIYSMININKGFGKEPVAWTFLGFLVMPVWAGILAWGKDTYDDRLANGPYFLTNPVSATGYNSYEYASQQTTNPAPSNPYGQQGYEAPQGSQTGYPAPVAPGSPVAPAVVPTAYGPRSEPVAPTEPVEPEEFKNPYLGDASDENKPSEEKEK